MYFALVKDGIIVNIIVADEIFVDNLTEYDQILDVSNYEVTPQIGWEYTLDDDIFIIPEPIVTPIVPDEIL